MAQVREAVYKTIQNNSLDAVVFREPLSEDARKAKRNLVAASFLSILIAALDIHVNSFLGIQATLNSELTRGVGFLIVAYFLAAFVVSAFVDVMAWKFEREKVLVAPYVELIQLVEQAFQNAANQIKGAMGQFDYIEKLNKDPGVREGQLRQRADSARGQLLSVSKGITAIHEEIQPLLHMWRNTLTQAEFLTWRLRARILSLWGLDIALPIALAAFALFRTHDGVSLLWCRIFG